MNVTWRSAGTLCRERNWSKRRLLHELQHGLPYQTIPPGHTVNWHHDVTAQTFNVEASEVTTVVDGPEVLNTLTVGVEVLPPTEVTESPTAPASSPARTAPPAPRNISEADLRDCLLAIVKERPDDPPGENELLQEMETRLGAPVARDRLRAARKEHAPNWLNLRGRPRRTAQ